MKRHLRNSLTMIALLASVGAAAAAGAGTSPLHLTGAQERNIYQSVSKLNVKENAPDGFKAAIGARVPDPVTLRPLPSSVTTEVPAVRRYEYAMLQNDVLIIHPKSRKVADIITQ